MVDSLRAATSPKNVVSAFRKGGIIGQYNDQTGMLMANVDTSYVKNVRHFTTHRNPDEMDDDQVRIDI